MRSPVEISIGHQCLQASQLIQEYKTDIAEGLSIGILSIPINNAKRDLFWGETVVFFDNNRQGASNPHISGHNAHFAKSFKFTSKSGRLDV